jgi:hypothetical protein
VELTVCIGTYGKPEWRRLARERAIPSAQAPVIHCHADTLSEARNAALEQVETEWVCFLDADDELVPGYFGAMEGGTADVRGPMARYVSRNRTKLWQPRVAGHYHDCEAACLPEGNWLLVGSVAPAELIRGVGGWDEWPVYEDWALWLKCWKAGAKFELIPDAIYQAHVRPDSRNRAPSGEFKNAIHKLIADTYLQEAAA